MSHTDVVVLTGTYDLRLVALSILIAVLASHTALDLIAKRQENPSAGATLSRAAAMGTGIWASHFTGLLAFRAPAPVSYDILTVALSVLVAVLASAAALLGTPVGAGSPDTLATKGRAPVNPPPSAASAPSLHPSSFSLGLAIAGTHYLGLAAIRGDLTGKCNLLLVLLSFGLAIGLSSVALWGAGASENSPLDPLNESDKRQNASPKSLISGLQNSKLSSVLFLAAAISGLIYTGMTAVAWSYSHGEGTTFSFILETSWPVSYDSLWPLSFAVTLLVLGLTALTSPFQTPAQPPRAGAEGKTENADKAAPPAGAGSASNNSHKTEIADRPAPALSGAENLPLLNPHPSPPAEPTELLAESERRLAFFNQVLAELALRASESRNLQVLLRDITETAARTLEVQRASVWLLSDFLSSLSRRLPSEEDYSWGETAKKRQSFAEETAASNGQPNNLKSKIQNLKLLCLDLYELGAGRHSQGRILAAADCPAYFQALAKERIVAAGDVRSDPRTRELSGSHLTPFGITSALDAAVLRCGVFVGVICLHHEGSPRRWALEEQCFASCLADFLALSVEACDRANTEASLTDAYSELEIRVRELSAQLEAVQTTDVERPVASLQPEIAQRLPAEVALQLAQFSADTSAEAIFWIGEGGRFLYVNDAALRLLGCQRDELLAMSVSDLDRTLDAAIRERAGFSAAPAGEGLASFTLESLLCRRLSAPSPGGGGGDGHLVPVELTVNYMEFNASTYACVFARDTGIGPGHAQTAQVPQAPEIGEPAAPTPPLAEIFEQGPIPMAITGSDGRFVRVSYALCQMLGYTEAELSQLTLTQLAGPEDPDGTQLAAQLFRGEISNYTTNSRYVKKNGEILWVTVTASLIRDGEGRPLWSWVTFAEIAFPLPVQPEAAKSEALFRTLAETSAAAIFICGEKGQFLYVNPATEAIAGPTAEELQKMQLRDIIHPDFRHRVERVGPSAPCRWEVQLLGKTLTFFGGEERWVDLTASAIEFEGQPAVLFIAAEIGERVRVLAQLRESEERYRRTVEDQTELICRFLPDGTLTYANDAFYRHFDSQPAFLVGHCFMPAIPEEDREMVAKNFRALSPEVPAVTCEHRIAIGNGKVRWLQWTDRGIFDAGGRLVEVQAVGRDITEEKLHVMSLQEEVLHLTELLESLQQNQERLDSILGSLQDVVWSVGAEHWELLYMNSAAQQVYGRPVSQFLGNRNLWLEVVHPEDRERVAQLTSTMLKAGSADMEYRILRPSGEVRWLRYRARVVREAGSSKAIRIDGISSDITERKLAEEERQKLALLVEHSSNFIGMISLVGKVLFLNQAGRSLVGIDRAGDLLSINIRDCCTPETWKLLRDTALPAARETGHWLGDGQLRHFKTGSTIDVQMNIFLVRHPQSGEPLCIGTVVRDITERKRYEAALVEAREVALATSRIKSQFLANMSHEIRTPMNGVLGMAGLLAKTELTAEQRDFVETIQASGQNLLRVINDILDFSKLEAGVMQLENIEFDLSSCLEDVVDLLATPADAKGIELMGWIDSDVPRKCTGDPVRLRQILMNLTGNAIKFTALGEVVVQASLQSETPTEATIFFRVTDTGIGISEEDLHKLFQSFSQVDASTTRQYGGTGLGLAISKQLVELMGGEIGLESKVGQGSTFWFTVRLGKPASRPNSEGELSRTELAGVTLLVVDDSATNRFSVAYMASSWGMRVREASSGLEALKALRGAVAARQPFDIAMVDMQMPQMDGEKLCKSILLDPTLARTRLVVMTSLSQRDIAERIRKAGFGDYLIKPVKESRLFDILVTALARPARNEIGGRNFQNSQMPKSRPPITSPSSSKPQPPTTLPPQVSVKRRNLKILVVEDNAINQKVVINQLKQLGYLADCAGNGQEALDILQKKEYDIVLMDCQMPVLDGYGATEVLRKREGADRHTVVIAMTANAMKGDRERCLAAGMDDYLSKPVDMTALGVALDRWEKSLSSRQEERSQAKEPVEPAGVSSQTPPESESSSSSSSGMPASSKSSVPDIAVGELMDMKRLNGVSGGDVEFQRELLEAFVADAAAKLAAIKQALHSNDFQTVVSQAHQLKGASSNVGVPSMQAAAKTLEMQAREQNLQGADELVASLENTLKLVEAFMASQVQ
ncbi:PAS domain S-box protein [Kamptonema formosum]|uniref:PAS domain S-box protein n=1 Tax=Kamptonema formosum TaxID=331992 RepID=UPI00034C05F4|nr:PAS domain S-box protein [Oscillatoria sp. PCC 10802]